MRVYKHYSLLTTLFAVAASLFFCECARASTTTYTYTGNDYNPPEVFNVFIDQTTSDPTGKQFTFYTAQMSVTGSFTLAAPLAPNLVNMSIDPAWPDGFFVPARRGGYCIWTA
jgi:hypothetical protein